MSEEPTRKQSMLPLDTSTRLAYERYPGLPLSLAGVMAAFIALLGILALLSAILRQ
jgi:hypothetical protein